MAETTKTPKESFRELQEAAGFEVIPCTKAPNLSDKGQFTPLSLNPVQQKQIENLIAQLPNLIANEANSDVFAVSFPHGLADSMTSIISTFAPVLGIQQATLLSAFSAMLISAGQHYLTQVNSGLSMIHKKTDEILAFLYGEKKAELLAEVNFVQYAQKNFTAISLNDAQHVATIGSLQDAKKIAIKDIEFYLTDLTTIVSDSGKAKNAGEFEDSIVKALQIEQCISLSVQLYVLGSILEVYYAQNFEPSYLEFIEEQAKEYIGKCNNRLISLFSILTKAIEDFKDGFAVPGAKAKKFDKSKYARKVSRISDDLETGKNADLIKMLHTILLTPAKQLDCYLSEDGKAYVKH